MLGPSWHLPRNSIFSMDWIAQPISCFHMCFFSKIHLLNSRKGNIIWTLNVLFESAQSPSTGNSELVARVKKLHLQRQLRELQNCRVVSNSGELESALSMKQLKLIRKDQKSHASGLSNIWKGTYISGMKNVLLVNRILQSTYLLLIQYKVL